MDLELGDKAKINCALFDLYAPHKLEGSGLRIGQAKVKRCIMLV